MRPALAILLLAFVMSPARADQLDDWCKTARLPASIAICGDAELRTLAIERSRAFVEAEARLSPDQQKALLADQNDWVRSYTRVCGLSDMPPGLTLAPEVKACMARAGWARIAYLRAYGSFSAPPPMGQASAPFAQTPPASATVASSPTRIGPSFDCSKAYSPLALMICASPALSKVDLRFVQAYRALWQQVGKEGQRELLGEAVDFQNAVQHACRIPETGPISGSPECVAAEYERQRSIWLSRLNGPASEEASRPIEQQIALQALLQKLGFLPAAVTIDGVYGDATRSSILAWQGVNRRPQTGFLDDADATALAGTGETEATPATQSPSPGQGVPGVGSAPEAATGRGEQFDILGMKLGMSIAEIEAAIKAYNPALRINVVSRDINDVRLGGGVIQNVIQIVDAGDVPVQGSPLEDIKVAFTVTEPNRAFYIRRETRFPDDKQPLIDEIAQQLREKYGREPMSSLNGTALDWVIDKAGKQIVASMPLFKTCAHLQINMLGYKYLPNYPVSFGGPPYYAPECNIHLKAALRHFGQSYSDPQLLSLLDEQLVGDSIATDDIQRLMAEAKTAQEQLHQHQEQKASGVKPPL